MASADSAFSWADKLQLLFTFGAALLVVLTLVFNPEHSSPILVAIVAGIGLIVASYSLAWGTEVLQFVVSQVLALAILALVQVLPEYSIEAVLAYHGATMPIQITYATASMTGANRLLLGVGWPLIVFISFIATKRRETKPRTYLLLEPQQSVEVFFLAIATAYSFVILAKGTLDIADAVVLVAIYSVYLYIARKIPPVGIEEVEGTEGPPRAILKMSQTRKAVAIVSLLAIGIVLIVIAADPFVRAVLQLAVALNLSEYLFVQWIAPVLTELPEALTAFYWATRSRYATVAIANLVSSKVNQWTLLIATIPVVYSVALGSLQPIHLTRLQGSEILLTAAQSAYGVACLLDLKFGISEASTLLSLFLVQFFFPEARFLVTILFIFLSVYELARTYRKITVFSNLRDVIKQHLS
jgi:cation:H+ antiporter